MKHFTFFITLLMLSTLALGQNYSELQYKLERLQKAGKHFPDFQSLFLQSATSRGSGWIILKSTQQTHFLDSIIYQSYDAETDSWINEEKDFYQYTNEGRVTNSFVQVWDAEATDWIEDFRMEYEYNENNQVSRVNDYLTDTVSGESQLVNITNAVYDNDDRIDYLEYLVETEDGNWIPELKQVFHYSEGEQIARIDLIVWDEEDGVETIDTASYIYIYDSEGRLESSNFTVFFEGMEVITQETRFTYDEAGRRSSMEFSNFDFMDMELVNVSKTDYVYSVEDPVDVASEIYSIWDENDWLSSNRDDYSYNNLLMEDVNFPLFFTFGTINPEIVTTSKAVSEILSYEAVTLTSEEWELSDRTLFFYSEGTPTSVPHFEEAVISVYPNPVNDVITFTFKGVNTLSLEIYNIAGGKVIDRQINPGNAVPVRQLSKGVYLYHLRDQNGILQSGKLIKN